MPPITVLAMPQIAQGGAVCGLALVENDHVPGALTVRWPDAAE
jgi:hypothetical protein